MSQRNVHPVYFSYFYIFEIPESDDWTWTVSVCILPYPSSKLGKTRQINRHESGDGIVGLMQKTELRSINLKRECEGVHKISAVL